MNKNNINLTTREEEVLFLLLKGYSNTQIAKYLSVSAHTVKAHIESIYRKFNVHNKVQATIYAIANGFVDINDFIKR